MEGEGKGQRDEGREYRRPQRCCGEPERGLPAAPAPLQGGGEAPRHGADTGSRRGAEPGMKAGGRGRRHTTAACSREPGRQRGAQARRGGGRGRRCREPGSGRGRRARGASVRSGDD